MFRVVGICASVAVVAIGGGVSLSIAHEYIAGSAYPGHQSIAPVQSLDTVTPVAAKPDIPQPEKLAFAPAPRRASEAQKTIVQDPVAFNPPTDGPALSKSVTRPKARPARLTVDDSLLVSNDAPEMSDPIRSGPADTVLRRIVQSRSSTLSARTPISAKRSFFDTSNPRALMGVYR